jgi:Rieske Fe-S protein
MSKNLSETIKQVMRGEERSDESDVRAASAPFQADFPYERDQEAEVTRREFCSFLGLTSAALFLGAGGVAAKAALDARGSESFAAARIEGAETLALNSSLNFSYPTPRDSAILISTTDGAYHAYGQKCTHLSCPVYYSRDQQRLECPCHEGAFDAATGNVLYGPPPRPLDAIEVEIRDGQVWAIGRRASTDDHAI